MRVVEKRPIGVVYCVLFLFVYSTNAIGMVVGAHFHITMISSLGWQGVTTLMCLERVTRRMGRGRQRTKSKRNWPYGNQPVKQPWRGMHASWPGFVLMKTLQQLAVVGNFKELMF